MRPAAPLQVLLVGAGHAHLHVIDQAEPLRRCGVDLSIVASAVFRYSGTASAVATGALPDDAGTIDVRRLAAARGVTHDVGRVVRLDPASRRAVLDDGRVVDFDVASFNIGSIAATSGMHVAPGSSRPSRSNSWGQSRRTSTDRHPVPRSAWPSWGAVRRAWSWLATLRPATVRPHGSPCSSVHRDRDRACLPARGHGSSAVFTSGACPSAPVPT